MTTGNPRARSDGGVPPRRTRWLYLLGVLVLGAPLLRPASAELDEPVRVVRVIDGDTVVVRRQSGPVHVRILGVDTPEAARRDRPAEPWAEEATRFSRQFLRSCPEVTLEIAGDRRDEHGRTLGFLRCRDTPRGAPRDLSTALLRRGLARAIRFYSYPHKEVFLALEAQARAAGRGVWTR